jgi:hypothetical protein
LLQSSRSPLSPSQSPLLRKTTLSPCHPDRSEAKWRDLQLLQSSCSPLSPCQSPLLRKATLSPCHPDRSEAQWRDLQLLRSSCSQLSPSQSPLLRKATPLPLSSRPERSEVEGSAVAARVAHLNSVRPSRHSYGKPPLSPCHPDRSEAKWRDQQLLQSSCSPLSPSRSPLLRKATPLPLSSRPERSEVEGSAVAAE